MPVAKTAVEYNKVVGVSEHSWEEAAKRAVAQATEEFDKEVADTVGIEVQSFTGDVEDGEIRTFTTTVEVAFPVKNPDVEEFVDELEEVEEFED